MLRKFFGSIFLILILVFNNGTNAYARGIEKKEENKQKYSILVDISEFDLYLIDNETHKAVKTYPIAGGKPTTPSPYGTWRIIGKAEGWGAGFGTRWMRMGVPWGQYGIHGTNKPLTINNPDSLGCIRMFNSDIEQLYKLVDRGTLVVIYGGPYGLDSGAFRTLAPGDKGAEVFEVQRRLQDRGYFLGEPNGIYDEKTKEAVLKFKKHNNLEFTHFLDKKFYDALQMKPFE